MTEKVDARDPTRALRVPEELWEAVQARAEADDVSASEVVRRCIAAALTAPPPAPADPAYETARQIVATAYDWPHDPDGAARWVVKQVAETLLEGVDPFGRTERAMRRLRAAGLLPPEEPKPKGRK